MIIIQPLSRHWHFDWRAMKHLPYFPDLVLCDYDLISKPKPMCGESIAKREDILIAVWYEMAKI